MKFGLSKILSFDKKEPPKPTAPVAPVPQTAPANPAEPKAIVYSLRTDQHEYKHDEINTELFLHYLNAFVVDVWDFMVLEPSEPVGNVTFLQVAAPTSEYGEMAVEIGVVNPHKLEMYRNYTARKGDVLRVFTDYFEKQIPPDYSTWEDMSDEVNR